MEKEVYLENIEELVRSLNSNIKSGLSSIEAENRLKKYGYNTYKQKKKSTILSLFLYQFKSLIIYILLGAAVLSFFTGDHLEFIVITIIVVFIITLSFFEAYKASKDMEALNKLSPRMARVMRGRTVKEIDASEIVPGDILVLRRGDIVGADARLIEANNLQVDESALTGESITVNKMVSVIKGKTNLSQQINMVFGGSHVTNGDGKALVVRTGQDTEIGQIANMLKDIKEEETPLQKRIDKLGKQFSFSVIALCLFILLLGVFRGQSINDMMLLAVAVAVSGIPESLPAVIAIALAIGMKRMAKQKAIIKRLPAVETLGTCTVICTDKTGTLTQNKMVIEKIYTFDSEINVTGRGFTPEGLFIKEDEDIDPKKHKGLQKIIEIGVLCNNSNLVRRGIEWEIDGESTEGALVVLAKKAGIEKTDFHQKFPRLHEHPFDPVRKCMSTVHVVKNKKIVYVKGAPERILEKSNFYLEGENIRKLDKKTIQRILDKTKEYASQGRRVLALAYKEHKEKTFELKYVESSLILVGLVSIRDPPADSVLESIKLCKEAGVKVVMITGDNEITAKAIAQELGIFEEGHEVVTGDKIDSLNENDFLKIVESISVYARTTPKHKLRIVEALQKKGHIVAMTGDGVNDAPALKKADIGIAMGKRGTEVAKESAEMVIKDDNFTTIVSAIREGRTIYTNIRKFVYYLLAGNFSEVILMLIAIILGVLPPLTPIMILFINCVTSDIPALGLCAEKSSEKIMKQRPRNPKEGILSDYLFLKIGEVVPIIVLGTIALYIWELTVKHGDIMKAQTIAFVTVIIFELFHIFNAKSFDETAFSKKTFTNPTLFIGYILSLILTIIVVHWHPANQIFGTVPLTLKDWFSVVLMAFTVLLFVEIQKTIISSEIREREKMELYPTRR